MNKHWYYNPEKREQEATDAELGVHIIDEISSITDVKVLSYIAEELILQGRAIGSIEANDRIRSKYERLINYSMPLPNNWCNEIPEACARCGNHPSNGGSGICNCTLGLKSVTSTY